MTAQVHAATLELPLEGPLLTGGLAFVLHVPPGGWHARERSGRSDFFVSTREVRPQQPVKKLDASCHLAENADLVRQ